MWAPLSRSVYKKIKRNHVEVIDLKTNESIARQATVPFSSVRNIIGDFGIAEDLIRDVLRELKLTKKFISPSLNILIQQIEGFEYGLSDIELRALRDVSEQVGGANVVVHVDAMSLSNDAALQKLKMK